MTCLRTLAAALVAASSFSCLAQQPALTDDDRAVLDKKPLNQAAVDRAAALGKVESLDALDHIHATNNLDLLRMYTSGFRAATKPTPEANARMQRKIVELWDRPWVGDLLVAPRVIDDPKLVDLVMGDVTALARWRAERRKSCTIALVSLDKSAGRNQAGTYAAVPINPAPAVREVLHETANLGSPIYWKANWRFFCSRPDAGDPSADLDGKPPVVVARPGCHASSYRATQRR